MPSTVEPAPLFPPRREHLEALTDELGIQQHARGAVPDPTHGTCTDDVARALLVDLDHADVLGERAVDASVRRSVAYLAAAFQPSTGRFRNFRAADGTWLDDGGSEDCQGRAMLGLAGVAARWRSSAARRVATELLLRAAEASSTLSAVRGLASALLACAIRIDPGVDVRLRPVLVELGDRLTTACLDGVRSRSWPWPEPNVTYENALPARALIVAGRRLGRQAMIALGLATLDWLVDNQVAPGGWFSPVGNRGWWIQGGPKARFDQQPIEAGSLILAAEAALGATRDARYANVAELAYAWFVGANDLGLTIADPERGACHDGLGPTGLNNNQGAESTLMWLASVEAIRRIRRAPVGIPVPITSRPGAGTFVRRRGSG
jgi:hypothetical protein